MARRVVHGFENYVLSLIGEIPLFLNTPRRF